MVTLYHHLLRLYPASHRDQFAEEMIAVFADVRSENKSKGLIPLFIFYVREITGLIGGALTEHCKILIGPDIDFTLFRGRFTMRNGFRFPKITAILMTLILAGVVVAIQKGEDIAASLPHSNPQIGPIQPVHSTLLPPIALLLALVYAAGTIGWIILFALRRSGVHRLAEMSGDHR